MHIGVDVGGTFTDLIAWDGQHLRVVKVPSTPPDFHQGVIQAVSQVRSGPERPDHLHIVHGSTVATNALLQRHGGKVAFVTTDGFGDVLLIGRQNRPSLYALRVQRSPPITPAECWFTVRERISATGQVVTPLETAEVDRVIRQIVNSGLKHVAVCLLFSFINPAHEQLFGERCRAAGLSVSLSSEILPEFREYERASTTTINAALQPIVQSYLARLEEGLTGTVSEDGHQRGCEFLRIMHSGGGTLTAPQATEQAARLVLSGPAGGVIGAAYIATIEKLPNIITYDMGGTSTDVATVIDGTPRRTTSSVVDGLPIGLPMFDIRTIGAGGGSIAQLNPGGALRVGPESAGSVPGPVCYGRGGTLPTVTDANVVLGRIPADAYLGGAIRLNRDAARTAIERLAGAMRRNPIAAALGIVTVAEANMAHAVRAVTSRRGLDSRDFALVSFGGAGGLHACAIAEELDIRRVLVPPFCGVLSALGMVVAPPVMDVSRTVLHLGAQLDDDRLAAEYGSLSARTIDQIPYEESALVEAMADVRFAGQSHEMTVRVNSPALGTIRDAFVAEYQREYGGVPSGREIEIVTLRLRRSGRGTHVELRPVTLEMPMQRPVELVDRSGRTVRCSALNRAGLDGVREGPLLVLDAEATTFVSAGWMALVTPNGSMLLERKINPSKIDVGQ